MGPHVRKNGGEWTRQAGVGGGNDPLRRGLHGAPGLRISAVRTVVVCFSSGVTFRKRSFVWKHGLECWCSRENLDSFCANNRFQALVIHDRTTTVLYCIRVLSCLVRPKHAKAFAEAAKHHGCCTGKALLRRGSRIISTTTIHMWKVNNHLLPYYCKSQ